MTDDNQSGSGTSRQGSNIPTSIPLVPIRAGASIDIGFLSDEERKVIINEYLRGTLDLGKKATELNIEVDVLRNVLGNLAATTKQVADDGTSVTVTHVHTTSNSRTEVIMGNTETAGKGRLTKSQTGERDWTPIYVIAGLITLVLIAFAFSSR